MQGLMSFSEALDITRDSKRHLLLGNGFSRALRNDIFSYDAILNRADFKTLSPSARKAFDAIQTTDFERMIKTMRDASKLVSLYDVDNEKLVQEFKSDAEGLKEVLVNAIAGNHPALPSEISKESYEKCRLFLSNFETYYTLNYDLLLYWTLMQTEILPDINKDDGFRRVWDEDGIEDYVTWDPDQSYKQNIFYLHGALHLFDAGFEIQKYTWKNTGTPLIPQIREALSMDCYPIFVSEGDSNEKYEKIQHSNFLAKGFKSLANIGGSLFVYGLSFSNNDDHILRTIEKNKVSQLFISVYGDPSSTENKQMIDKLLNFFPNENVKHPKRVEFYNASTASVWG